MSKRYAVYDEDNFRFIITPYEQGDNITPGALLRIIHKWVEQGGAKFNLRWMADFLGLNKATDAFKATYAKAYCPRNHPELEELIAIDVDKHEVYFYHHDHKPANVTKQHVGPTISNKEDEYQNVIVGIPSKVSTRVTVVDSVSRMLTMTLRPVNGYILGLNDLNLCQPNSVYQVVGSAKSLNNILRNIHFIGTEAGDGLLTVAVDDGAGDVASKFTTDIRLKIAAGTTVSVASVVLPENPKATLNEFVAFDPITIEDEDGRPCELRMTPFGCNITGFKNFLGTLVPGKVRKMTGRPETINLDIANLKVQALQENAQLGMEFISGNTRQLLYLVFEVAEKTEEAGNTGGEGGNTDNTNVTPTPTTPTTPESDPSQSNPSDPSQPTQQEEPEVFDDVELVLNAPESIDNAVIDTPTDVNISFSGTRTTKSVVEFSITGGQMICTGSGGIYTDSFSIENAPETLNNKISDFKVRMNAAEGALTVNYVGDNNAVRTVVISISATAA